MGRRWIFLTAFALVFYGTGAAFIEGFVNYASWPLIGGDEFVAYRRFISPRVIALLVAPLLLGTVFTILMPIQFQLSAQGQSVGLIERPSN